MNMLKQNNSFLATLWRLKRHLNRDDLFFISSFVSSFAFSTATSPIMVNNILVYYCQKMDVFIVVSVYQQKLTPPVEI